MNPRKLLWVVLAWIVLPFVSFAEETAPVISKLEPVDCFAPGLYKFQSVQVSVGPELDTYKAGETIKFSGEIINENSYPVVDGNVYVRISKVNADAEDINITWHDVVDEFVALSDVSINGSSTKPAEFSWKIPSSLGKGDYRSDYFFSVDKRFNLGGLPFTNEIVIGTAYFSIDNSTETAFELDREGTTVNGESYKHIGNWPLVDPDSRVKLVQPLKNLSDKDLTFDVSYELYYWDSLRAEDKIDSKIETVTVPADKSVDLSYVIDAVKEPVYYLKITAKNGDTQSIVNLRITSDIPKMRLNYPAVNNFPILKGEESTLFSCFHMTSDVVSNGKLVLTLTDKKDNIISTGEYSAEVSGYMDAAAIKFTTDKDLSFVKLKAELFDENNKVVDQYETTYDCLKIGGTECQALTKVQATTAVDYIGIALILLVALVSILITVRIKKLDNKSSVRKGLFVVLVVLIVILVALVVRMTLISVDVKDVGAETVTNSGRTKTETKSDSSVKVGGFVGDNDTSVDYTTWSGYANFKHTVKLTDGTRINDSTYKIKKGSTLGLTLSTECNFNRTGGAWDTPVCGNYEIYNSTMVGARYPGVIAIFNSTPDAKANSGDSTILSCPDDSNSSWTCTTNSTGDTTLNVSVSARDLTVESCVQMNQGVSCTEDGWSNLKNLYSAANHSAGDEYLTVTDGATIPAYTTTNWTIRVYDDGVCGTADNTSNYASNAPTVDSDNLCSSSAKPESITENPLNWTWICPGVNGGLDSKTCTMNKKIDGVCGSANDNSFLERPTTNLCNYPLSPLPTVYGTGSATNPWKWTCLAANTGSNVDCKAYKTTNGQCGTAENTCATGGGVFKDVADQTNQSNWICDVTAPGVDATCAMNKGTCGSAVSTSYYFTQPTGTVACNSNSNLIEKTDSAGKFDWQCKGNTIEPVVGSVTDCSVNRDYYPIGYHDSSNCSVTAGWTCDPDDYTSKLAVHFYADGPAGTGTFLGATTANMVNETAVTTNCGGNAGHRFSFATPDSVKSATNRTIYAYAINVGGLAPNGNVLLTSSPKTINCPIVGTCGTAQGTNVYTQPTGTAACVTGNSFTDTVDDVNKFNWTCTRLINNVPSGAVTKCYANEIVNGQCGTSLNSCSKGTLQDVADTYTSGVVTQYNWNCVGVNTGTTASCVMNVGQCGTANGTNVYIQPIADQPTSTSACKTGDYLDITIDPPSVFRWYCVGAVNGSMPGYQTPCYAYKKVDGVCNPEFYDEYGQSLEIDFHPSNFTKPRACSAGYYENISPDDDGEWNWKCNGYREGINVNCYAIVGGDYEPTKYKATLRNGLIGSGKQCYVNLKIIDAHSTGQCFVKTVGGSLVETIDYPKNKNNTTEEVVTVDPQNEYQISCKDSVVGAPEATDVLRFKCSVTPTVIEQ